MGKIVALVVLATLVALACTTSTAPQSPPAAAQTATAPTPAVATPTAPATGARIVNPHQEVNDRIAKQVLTAIAGRENEPAEQVFKNIQSMKGMPAGRLVGAMNMGFSRALGVSCLHCHVEADFASDDQRPKRAAREMMGMNRMINEHLKTLKNLDGKPEETFVNCTTCHRGRIDPNSGLQ